LIIDSLSIDVESIYASNSENQLNFLGYLEDPLVLLDPQRKEPVTSELLDLLPSEHSVASQHDMQVVTTGNVAIESTSHYLTYSTE
jgi:hypothetical protein